MTETVPGETRIDDLVMSARCGDEGAFGDLYRAFAPRVYRFFAFRVSAWSDAEDLTQQTSLKMIEALPRYEARGLPFGAWLFRIARNLVIDFERARREPVDLEEIVQRGGDGQADDRIAGADDRDALVRALVALTPDQRDVIAYRFFADLPARDVGRLMGRDEATVRGLQARAIAALRRGLLAAMPSDTTPPTHATLRAVDGVPHLTVIRRAVDLGFLDGSAAAAAEPVALDAVSPMGSANRPRRLGLGTTAVARS
ncbi:MAG: sigma-70 family RNA polymerase sigma factor [Chloroflexota bacterium]|nr:sigma-70 family RNA polymerase sigma factor [Chloroflexota bacterium]